MEGADAAAVGAIEFRRRLQELKEQRDHVFHEYDQHALRAKMFDQMTVNISGECCVFDIRLTVCECVYV